MNNDNEKNEIESLKNCSKFVQKFKELLKQNNEIFRSSSINNDFNSRNKKGFSTTNKNKSNQKIIKSLKGINNFNNDIKERYSYNLKYKITPKKYLLNFESISQRKDSIFQFNKIKEYLDIIKKSKSIDENYSNKNEKENKNISEEKTPK